MSANPINNVMLAGGGEMGSLIRTKDWSQNAVGSIDKWPPQLLFTLSIVLNAKSPMFLWWGPSLIQFYNDAYRQILGRDGKHPTALGQNGESCWQEIWPVIKPMIDQVFGSGEAIYKEDELLPIYRNKALENVYWTFTYNPVKNETGVVDGILVICNETTGRVLANKKTAEAEARFRQSVMQAPVGIALLTGRNFLVDMANATYLSLAGKSESELIGRPLFDALPEIKEVVDPLLTNVLNTGKSYFNNEQKITLNRKGTPANYFFNLIYQPITDTDGVITGIMVVANDVTAQVNTRLELEETEKQFGNLVMQSPIPMVILKGKHFIIDTVNHALLKNIWLRTLPEVQGKGLLEVFPELAGQKFPALLEQVRTTGVPYKENEAMAIVGHPTGSGKYYLDFEYAPLFEQDGSVSGVIVTIYDVTEKVETRQSLKESAERLTLATEGTNLAIWDLKLSTRDIIYTPRLAGIFGYEDSKVMTHQEMRDLIYEDDKVIVHDAFKIALKTGLYSYEARIVHPNAQLRWIKTVGKVIFDEDGQPLRMLGTMRDVTESHENEENLAKLAAIVQSSADVIIGKTMDGIITSWNASAERVLGYTTLEMIGQPVSVLIPEHLNNEEPAITARLKNGEQIPPYETQRLTKDKKLLNVSLTISPVKDKRGNIIGASKIMRDITAQKQAERLIRQSEEKFRLLSDSMPQLIWTGDRNGNLNYYNQAVYDYSGYSPQKMEEVGWLDIVHPDDKAENIRKWMLSVSTGDDFLFEHRFKRHDGEYRWQLSRAVAQKDNRGIIQMWVGTSTDIDDIKKHEQQKDYFIKMASHELKTPITTIKGYIQLLLKTHGSGTDALLSTSLFTINNQITKLTKLITDLLDVSKIETGSLELRKEEFNLGELVKDMAHDLETTNSSHKIAFSADTNALVWADKDRISQVINNLLTNAVKYSPKANSINVNVTHQNGEVIVSVEDFGIGIAAEDHTKVFERFYRVSGKDEKTFPGFGIGLFIVNEIIGLHQGKIWLKSNKDEGSVFYFSLPVHH